MFSRIILITALLASLVLTRTTTEIESISPVTVNCHEITNQFKAILKNHMFIITKSCVGSFSYQLFNVLLSFVDALKLNLKSVILGEISSHYVATREYRWLQFHEFIDVSFFHSYWKKKRNIITIEKRVLKACSNHFDLLQTDKSALKNYHSNVCSSSTKLNKSTFHYHEVLQSFRPNFTLRRVIKGIMNQLGKNCISVHSFDYSLHHMPHGDIHDPKNLNEMIQFMSSFPSIQLYYRSDYSNYTMAHHKLTKQISLNNTQLISTPNIYISGGLFHLNMLEFHMAQKSSLLVLQRRGLENIFTHFNFSAELLLLSRNLTMEQIEYVEIEICRLSSHFIPSIRNSSFSNIVLQMRNVRNAYLITLNRTDARTIFSKNLLETIGFHVHLVDVIHHEDKVISNKISMIHTYKLILKSNDNYAYVFENDINLLEPVDINEIVQYETINEMFFYLGYCSPGEKKYLPTNYTINGHKVMKVINAMRGLHAIGISKKGIEELLKLVNFFNEERYMDVLLEQLGLIYPPCIVRYDLESYNEGHIGIMFQDRESFASTIPDQAPEI